ncbi:hypothetical protein [Micromonospora sp. b486]|uniref:hypothetical protein n=1 Tax=Micromonospora sp. b486 TaxID=3053986 RepID=UPI00338F0892
MQVNFQALGSAALAELTGALGRLGPVTGIATLAAWQRPDAYYARSPWAGRRTVDGRPALDGALANPLAHALMQCLAVAESVTGAPVRPARIEVERYRVRPIEVDDTTVLRLTPHAGPPVLAALTLAAEEHVPGEVLVTGERGRAVLEYPTDRLRLPGDDAPRPVPGRRGLLANLLDHRADGTPLIAPLARTEPFTRGAGRAAGRTRSDAARRGPGARGGRRPAAAADGAGRRRGAAGRRGDRCAAVRGGRAVGGPPVRGGPASAVNIPSGERNESCVPEPQSSRR